MRQQSEVPMPKHLLERLTGVGTIFSGDQPLRTTSYQLSIWAAVGSPAQAASPTIDGSIDIQGIAEAVVLAGPDSLMLRLEDGRCLPFALTGTGGRIVGRGELQRPGSKG
jgi:hypothetical protein